MHVASLSGMRVPDLGAAQAGFRYRPPRHEGSWVSRHDLVQRLAAAHGVVSWLAAPHGSGKTALLADLYAQLADHGMGVRWLTLSTDDNDVAVLRGHLVQAFACGEIDDADDLCVPADIAGFIDGMDCLTDPAACERIERFVLSLPVGSRMYVATTGMRGALLYEGTLRGIVQVIGGAALRMSDAEASTLLGDAWSAEQAQRLNRLVDGWAAGLRFLARAPDAGRLLLDGGGEQTALPPEMSDYFEDVVCGKMPPDILESLMDLSVFGRFTLELVAAMPCPPCNWSTIDALVRDGMFVRYADGMREWVVVHPAFGRYLQYRLRRMRPDRHQALTRFAAIWFEENGFTADAVRHAASLQETPLAARIVEDAGAISVDLGDGPDVGLERYLHASRARDLPLLFIGQIYHRIRHGKLREARAAFEQAGVLTRGFTQLHEGANMPVVQAWAHLFEVVFLTAEDLPIDVRHIDVFETNLRAHMASQPVLAASIASVLAFVYFDRSRHAESAAICRIGLQAQRAANSNKVLIFLRIHQASNALARDTLEQAMLCMEDASRLMRMSGQSDSYEALSAQIMCGVLHYENNELDAAWALLSPALARVAGANGWVRLYAAGYEAAAAIAGERQGLDAVEAVLRAGEHFARERALPRLLRLLAVIRLRERTRAADWRGARSLSAQPAFASLLEQDSLEPYVLAQQLPALMETARLMIEQGRPSDAAPLLERVNKAFLEEADNRWRFGFRVLAMRMAYGLRRYNAALDHMLAAIEIARHAGLVRRALEERRHLIDVADWALRTGRRLPEQAIVWIDAVLRQAAGTESGDTLRQNSPRRSPGRVASNFMLSPREGEIIALVAEGYTNKEIAIRLGISDGTVKTHRKNVYDKLGVSSRSQALMRARELLII